MALTYDDISAQVTQEIVPELVDVIFKAGPTLTRIQAKGRTEFEGGLFIQQPIMYNRLKSQAIGRGSTIDVSYVQTDTALKVNLKYYVVPVTLFGTDRVLSRGKNAAMLHAESKIVNAAGSLAEDLDTDLFQDGQGTGSSVLELDGFRAAIDDGNQFASYAGITRSDIATGANVGINSYFKSVPTLSLPEAQTAYGATWFGNQHADLIVTTQAVWDILWNKFQPQQRVLDESSDVGKIGFQALKFNAATLVVDQYCPAGKMFFLNTDYTQFWISNDQLWGFGFDPWRGAQTTMDVVGKYCYAGNILITNPRFFAQLTDIVG